MAFMPLTPNMNCEDLGVANVKGDKTTKFSISNRNANSNTEAMLCNAGEPGHILAGKFKPFKNKDILQMIGVYIIDGPAPSAGKAAHPRQQQDCVCHRAWMATEAPVILALLCMPGSVDNSPSKNPMSKHQDQWAVPMVALHLEGGMGVGKRLLDWQAVV
jgi:hypothetical protein